MSTALGYLNPLSIVIFCLYVAIIGLSFSAYVKTFSAQAPLDKKWFAFLAIGLTFLALTLITPWPWAKYLSLLYVAFFFMTLVYKMSLRWRIYVAFIGMVAVTFASNLAHYGLLPFLDLTLPREYILGSGISHIIASALSIALIFYLLRKISHPIDTKLISNRGLAFLVIPVFILLLANIYFFAFVRIPDVYPRVASVLVSSVAILSALILWLYYQQNKQTEMKYHLMIDAVQNLEEKNHNYQKKVDDLLDLHHDHRRHLATATHLIQEGYIDQAQTYLRKMSHTYKKGPSQVSFTGNIYIDAVLGMKLASMKEERIPHNLAIMANLDQNGWEDLSLALFNLLDNAIQATQETDQPFIKLTIKQHHQNLVICIDNSYDSRKKRRKKGRGLRIAREIVESRQGQMHVSAEEEFHVSMMVPIQG